MMRRNGAKTDIPKAWRFRNVDEDSRGEFATVLSRCSSTSKRRHPTRRFAVAVRLRGILVAMSDVTRILTAIEQGDPHAADQLLPLVYAELRKLAAAKLHLEKPGQTLEATALVHEAYLRLVDSPHSQGFNTRGHFFAAAAEAMRRILVDNARRKQSKKRGGDRVRLDLDQVSAAASEHADEVLDIDAALVGLAKADAQAAGLVKLRYFAGMSIPEAAAVLGVSPRTADFLWAYSRAWLLRSLGGADAKQ
jgi:RNA polymerase sigma factor (TIGR02999 family)